MYLDGRESRDNGGLYSNSHYRCNSDEQISSINIGAGVIK